MCARLLACPLCSQPGFLTLDALRAGLISVATRPLICPVCNEVLLGIDKLTIHLFSHTINLNSTSAESLKHISESVTSSNPITVPNLQDVSFQDWNAPKVQSTEVSKGSNNTNLNNQCSTELPKNLPTTKDKVAILNSEVCMENQNLAVRSPTQVVFVSDQTCDRAKAVGLPEPHQNERLVIESCKSSEEILSEALKLNYATQFFPSDDSKHTSMAQNHPQFEQDNIETFKRWMQGQHYEQHTCSKNMTSTDITTSGRARTETTEVCETQQNVEATAAFVVTNKENKFPNFESFSNITPTCTDMTLERYNNEKNVKLDAPSTNVKLQNDNLKEEQILPHLKAFKILATKEKTERCNICGFHFPDYNILLLHKQLVHMIEEKDVNLIPEEFFKNYSCHLCSKVFKMRGSLMVHMRVAHIGYNLGSIPKDGQVELMFSENGYNCPTCGKKFKKEQHVIQHLKTHEAKQWECDVCSKMFTTKYFLKKHKRLHSGEMPYKCNICSKTFTFQQSYHKHRLYHKDDKPHTCTTCGRSFKELSTLHNHERIHTGEKPFACETCGKCFRQRVSYLVHRRIHTGVMPYKCTMCGKSFRYKVSQRTHKCPAQQVGTTQQANDLEQKLIQISNVQNTSNESCKIQKMNSLQENQPMLRVINNEDKYILIINTQGQHLLTRESDVANAQTSGNKEQNREFVGMAGDDKELKNIWNSNIPNSPVFRKSLEMSNKIPAENGKPNQQDNNDFFSMVMSPLQNGLSSPTAEMEHLRVSSPMQKETTLETYNIVRSTSGSVEIAMSNTSADQNFNNDNVTNTLQTINEESLKQLLYGINEK